ncbi:MAG: hypothetical protein ACXAEB_02645 [Candidatus Thorarchaeota archaeon]|jgi:hypothetical protein
MATHGKKAAGVEKKRHRVIQAKLSKVEFPEVCPVCMEEAEDLVAITILDSTRLNKDSTIAGTWSDGRNGMDAAIAASKGASTFWVATCMVHGSKNVTTVQKKVISVVGFFVLFYPILFYVLGVIAALEFARPMLPVLLPFVLLLILLIGILMYGFYPRALERMIKFVEINRPRDYVQIEIRNPEYVVAFLKINEMHSEDLGKRESVESETDSAND